MSGKLFSGLYLVQRARKVYYWHGLINAVDINHANGILLAESKKDYPDDGFTSYTTDAIEVPAEMILKLSKELNNI